MIDPLARVPVGTGVAVSRLGVGGGSSFGRAGDAGVALVDACWDAGLRYFDTAPLYLGGESERRFGEALAHRPRDAFVLSTKVGRLAPERFDYTRAGVAASLAASLERLRLTRIDIALIHDVDPDLHGEAFGRRFDEAMEGAYALLSEWRAQGHVRAIGVGVKDWDVCLRFARAGQFDCIMLAGGYTLLQHGALAELLPHCEAHGIPVLLAAPFNTGILATGAVPDARYYYQPAPEAILERTRAIEAICARHGVPLPAAALQFPLQHPAVASVVVGHERPGEVARNLALLRHPIPAALWAELKEEALLPEAAPTV
jgi:D-threo-aldose 1-dehydrogenase